MGKNNGFTDHSSLFKTSDVKEIPYYYYDVDTEAPICMMREGYARKLPDLKMRLELLGYTITSIRKMYEEAIQEHANFGERILLSFDQFYSIMRNIDISEIDTVKAESEEGDDNYDFGEFVNKCILSAPEIKEKILAEVDATIRGWELPWENALSRFFENLDPYITLRILSENKKNNQEVRWYFADVVENGWVQREEIVKPLPESQRVLIVTEGTSDTFVLRRTIDELYPDISDFFVFIDMKDNYPFTGTGNLYNFCAGLCQIAIQNNVIILFDNDTAGLEKYHQSQRLKKPRTFQIATLPDYDDFSNIQTVGPQGFSLADVNGKAVAIECFLDFNSVAKTPCIRWTSYNKNEKKYQGELESKEEYIKAFKEADLHDGKYDVSKLRFLIDYIIELWTHRDDEECVVMEKRWT